jgi:hypothetical protein
MATGALNAQGVWIYGEDDSNTTFSALLNRLGTSISSDMKGRIVQVVSSTFSTQVATTSTSFISTGLAATITPTKTSNRILVLANTSGSKSSDFAQTIYTLFRGTVSGTNLGNGANGMVQMFVDGAGANRIWSNVAINFLDSPSTTSAQTYTLAMRATSTTAPASAQQSNALGSIILMEISN